MPMTKIQFVKKLVLCLLFTLSFKLQAQTIQINLHRPISSTFGSKDVWSADIVNPSQSTLSVKLKSTISSSTGNILFEAVSMPINIVGQITSLNTINVITASSNYYNQQVQQSDETSRSFPTGSYNYCMFLIDAVTGETKAQQCIPITVKILTPPILIYPQNKETVQEKNPLLGWLLPGPTNNPNEIRYTLTLVEQTSNQNPVDAILRNRPLLYEKGLSQTSIQYPYQAPALNYGKNYAWQVEAFNTENVSYGKSEIWSFTVKADTFSVVQADVDQSFIEITKSAENAVYYATGVLKIKYSDRQFPKTLSYYIYDETGNPVHKNASTLMALAKENWYNINLENEFTLKHHKRYRFELYDGRNMYKLFFVYLNPVYKK